MLTAALLVVGAQAQIHSSPDVERIAIEFAIAVFPDESGLSAPVAPTYNPHPRNRRPGYWSCDLYRDGLTVSVSVSDRDGALLGLSIGGANGKYPGNLLNFIEIPPFRPWYRSTTEAFERVREVARLVGAPSHDQVTEAEVPEPDAEGLVTSRNVFVKLEPIAHGYPSRSVNHTSVRLDAKTGLVSEISQLTRYSFEPPAGKPVSADEAIAAALAAAGSLREPHWQGPQYMNMLDWSAGESWISARALSLLDSGAVPLVYTVYDREWEVRVDACSGEVLQVMDSRGERGDSRNLVQEAAGSMKPGSWTGLIGFVAVGSALVVVVYFLTKG